MTRRSCCRISLARRARSTHPAPALRSEWVAGLKTRTILVYVGAIVDATGSWMVRCLAVHSGTSLRSAAPFRLSLLHSQGKLILGNDGLSLTRLPPASTRVVFLLCFTLCFTPPPRKAPPAERLSQPAAGQPRLPTHCQVCCDTWLATIPTTRTLHLRRRGPSIQGSMRGRARMCEMHARRSPVMSTGQSRPRVLD